jgi:hypothetical protein
VTADFEYLTETWTSSWGGSLGRGSLEKFLNDQRRLGFELVSVCQIMEGHDMRGEVGTVSHKVQTFFTSLCTSPS